MKLCKVITIQGWNCANLGKVGTIRAKLPLSEGGIGPNLAKLALFRSGIGPTWAKLSLLGQVDTIQGWIWGQNGPKCVTVIKFEGWTRGHVGNLESWPDPSPGLPQKHLYRYIYIHTHIYINVSVGGPALEWTSAVRRFQVDIGTPLGPFEFDDSYTLWPLLAPYPPLDSINSTLQAQVHPWMVSTCSNVAQFPPYDSANLAKVGPIPPSESGNSAQIVPTLPNLAQLHPRIVTP